MTTPAENTELYTENTKANKNQNLKNMLICITEWGNKKMLQAYCVKCRTKRDMINPQNKELKNGRIGKFSKCPVCKTNMFRIG